jgi:vancomycin resistance protein YoaR
VRTRWVGLALLAVLGTAALGVGTVVALRAGEALPGTSVSGVAVGGLDAAQIRTQISGRVADSTTGSLELVHEELTFSVQREDLGVQADLDATVDRALAAGRSDGLDRVLGPLLGRGEAVDLAVDVAGPGLRPFVDSVGDAVDRDPFGGALVVEGITVTAQVPSVGRTLDRDETEQALAEALATGRDEPLPLPVEEQEPPTTADDVERVAAQARDALAGPLRLTSPEATLELAPATLGPLLRAESAGSDDLQLGVDREGLTAAVQAAADRLDRAPVQATVTASPAPPTVDTQGNLTFSPQPATLSVQPGQPGLAVQVEPSVEALLGLVGGPAREAPLPVDIRPPVLSADPAQTAGVNSLLGTFTTYFTAGQPRAANIRRIAQVLDNSSVAPGDRLSLNGVAGARTTAKGYVADGAIIDGQLEDVVGGGVSQFATTLFNAAFFAGLPIEQHQPHSFYISRYPAGRESTVNFGSIDVVVRNDTATPFVVKTSSTAGSVTVSIYGNTGGRTVSSTSGPRQPRSGGGFTINVTRTVTGGDGRGGTRVFRTVYNPPPDD